MKLKLFILLLLMPFVVLSQSSWNMNLLGSFTFPSANCNDIWGWENAANEYALVGLSNGFSCLNVTNPTSPTQEFFISDMNSTWRDIKTWGNYAYITTEANAGLLIVDLTDMSGGTYWHQTQFSSVSGSTINFTSAHNLYIDENGIAYIFGLRNYGSPVANRGVIMLDVAANPTNPIYLGQWNSYYVHDGMVRGDTMYLGCVYEGKLFVVDVSDKANPITLGQHATPNNFTHNAWVSDNGNYVFTTDEQSNAFLTSYDISNLNNIQEVDRTQSNPGSNSIPHNVHVDGNFLITSYYRDGTVVHDITYPNHMVQVASYDSYAGSGNGFNGCWGTYPFLSSGNIISSDIDSYNSKGIVNIYGRAFQQACYLMGNVTDGSTGNNIANTNITILNTTINEQTNLLGDYQTAVVNAGTYQVIFSKNGYVSDTLQAVLANGIMTILDATLYPICYFGGDIITTNVSCHGGSDGTAIVQQNSNQPPFNVNWNNVNPNALSVGYYPIILTNNYCTIYDTISIQEASAITLNTAVSAVQCAGDCNGNITLSINGGNPPYDIQWYNNGTNFAIGQQVQNLCGGIYDYILTDSTNCMLSNSVNITNPPTLHLSVFADSILCYGGSSIATAYVNGGNTPYNYNWSNNATTQNTVLSAGGYSVEITDANGCLIADSIIILQHDSIALSLMPNPITCFGLNDGSIQVQVLSGGLAPFQYSISNGAAFQNNNLFTSLSSGNYNVIVKDANQCLSSQNILITEPLPISVNSSTSNVSCFGSCDGSINLSISGGTPVYTTNWNGVNPNALCAGTYFCTIIDANGCAKNETNTITEPSVLSSQITQNGNALDAFVNGGTPPYTYLWNTLEVGVSITPTQNGVFWLITTDANGCVADTSYMQFDYFPLGVSEMTTTKQLLQITNVLGKTTCPNSNTLLFYRYQDGTVERRMMME